MKRRFGRIFFLPVLIFSLVYIQSSIGTPLFAEGNGESPIEGKGYTSAEWQDALRSPSPLEVKRMKIPYKVKGVYMTGWSAGGEKFQKIVDLLDRSELNAVVIDVKEDKGDITYRSNIPLVHEIKSDHTRYIQDIDHVLEVLHEKNIYTIARIVSFKDPYMAGAKQEWSLQKKTGGVWKDRKGVMWVDPYRKEQWDYNLSVAIEAAKKGFDEIQLDYVRFPENGKKVDAEVSYYNPQGRTKEVLIRDFIRYVRENLKPYPVFLSADVFGLVP
ncbi:MAG: GTP-binding protein, partial [Thermicanus sp.]|nr:GTP-binding protein [Thermicanus sp.]